MQNKIRLKDVKSRVNKVQTHGDRPNHMSRGYSKELNVQDIRYFMNFQVVDHTAALSLFSFSISGNSIRMEISNGNFH